MDWTQRGAPAQTTTPTTQTTAGAGHANKRKAPNKPNLVRLASVALLFSATILVVALLLSLVLGSKNVNESKYVDNTKMQAVFLGNGQVYFGKIASLNQQYLRLQDIYYLRVNQQVQPNQSQQQAAQQDISLVKLGCELHGPTNEMLINREQVSFWENLKDDGQVAEAVKKFKADNPNGQECPKPGAGASTPAPATPAPAATTPAAPTTNTNNNRR